MNIDGATRSSHDFLTESTSQMDRRQQSLTFLMTSDIIAKLSSSRLAGRCFAKNPFLMLVIYPSPNYQLRLYCTSSTYYSPTPSFRPNLGPCPIEFPPTCEVRVNNVQLSANLKGMKKKPGTAPPPDLGKSLRLSNTASNRIEMVYVNSQQPAPQKVGTLAALCTSFSMYRPTEILSRCHASGGDDSRSARRPTEEGQI